MSKQTIPSTAPGPTDQDARSLSQKGTGQPRKAAPKANSPAMVRAKAPRKASPRPHALRREKDATTIDLLAAIDNNTLAANPLIGLRPADLASAARSFVQAVGKTPVKAGSHLASYVRTLGKIVSGNTEIAPHPADKRFADPAWQNNFLLRRVMQSHIAGHKELTGFINDSSLDDLGKGRAKFLTSMVMDALSPSNRLLFNPQALRKIVDTGGANVVTGLKQFTRDLIDNKGLLPSQVDSSKFSVGENIATAKGDVVFRNEMFELLQFAPTTPDVYARPLVMSPPQINKYYAIDLSPEKSLIKWMQDSGVQLFVVSWRNPTAKQRDWGLSEYALCLDQAVEVARQITGSPDVNMWGTCSGGMTLAAYLNWLAARNQLHKVANTSWAVCVLNTSAVLDDTTLGLFTTPASLRAARAQSERDGVLSGKEMARMFAWMRPNDLIWSYWINNYLLGNKPPAFDILAWNADTTNLPAKLHADYLDLVELNPYHNPGAMKIAGKAIDMRKVKLGAYVVGGTTDHITPWQGCYGTAQLFGADSTFVLSNAGHLQSFINPPGNPKSYFFAAKATDASAKDWLQGAGERIPGSWWPHWREWIQQRSGTSQPAPKKSGSRKYPALCATPGTYVME